MAKSKGGAGRTEKSKGPVSLPIVWLATEMYENQGQGGWFISPEGKIYDVEKISGRDSIHADAAWEIVNKGKMRIGDRDPEIYLLENGWDTVRLWNLRDASGRSIIGLRVHEDGQTGFRKANRLLDMLANLGLHSYSAKLDVAWGWHDATLEYGSGYSHEIQVDSVDFMSAENWRDVGG